MLQGPKQPAAKAASPASSVSFQEILSYFAKLEDSTKNNLIFVRFLARRLFETLSPSERIAFAGQIALLRFQNSDNIALVFRNPQDFVRSFFTLLLESYSFPVPKEKWGDFFKLVSTFADQGEKEVSAKKEKKERSSTSRQTESLHTLTSYFNNLDPNIITSLLPVFHAYATSKKGESSLFINHLSFPFIESKTALLVTQKKLTDREGIELGLKFRSLRQGKDCGVMFGLFRSLEEANQSYQSRNLAPDTQATIRLFYEKFVSDKFHFPIIWEQIESLKQFVESFSPDKKDTPLLPKVTLIKINDLWQTFFHDLCANNLSIDDIILLSNSTKQKIEALTGVAKKITQDDSATTPRRRAATEMNPRTKMPISPSMSNIVGTSDTISLVQLAASAASSPPGSHAPTPSPTLTPSSSFQSLAQKLLEEEPLSLEGTDLRAQQNYVPRFSVRPSTPQRPPRSTTVSLGSNRVSLLVPPLSPPLPPDRPGSTSPLSVNSTSSSPSPQGSPAGNTQKSTPEVSPGHGKKTGTEDPSAALDVSFQKLHIQP